MLEPVDVVCALPDERRRLRGVVVQKKEQGEHVVLVATELGERRADVFAMIAQIQQVERR